jgi:hypothetical protein
MLHHTDQPLRPTPTGCDGKPMMAADDPERAAACTDWARGARGILIWGVPGMALFATGSFLPGRDLGLVWPPLLAFMGAACWVNARRCGRVHCYATGPFLLLLAAATLLYGIGVLPLGPHGWSILSNVLIAGAVILCFVPEWLFGRYRSTAGRA